VINAKARYAVENPNSSPLRNDPFCVYMFGSWALFWAETRMLWLVLLCGLLGGIIYSLRSLAAYVGSRKFIASWIPFYIVMPVIGSLLAVVFYLVLRGGLFSSATSVSDTSPFGFAAIAALVGMFTQQAAEKLKDIFSTVLTSATKGKDPLDSLPVVSQVTVTSFKTGADAMLTITGDHFTTKSKVFADGQELTNTSFKDAKQLTAVLTSDRIPAEGKNFAIVVETEGGKSVALNVFVKPNS
jgi:hypothetical protein